MKKWGKHAQKQNQFPDFCFWDKPRVFFASFALLHLSSDGDYVYTSVLVNNNKNITESITWKRRHSWQERQSWIPVVGGVYHANGADLRVLELPHVVKLLPLAKIENINVTLQSNLTELEHFYDRNW